MLYTWHMDNHLQSIVALLKETTLFSALDDQSLQVLASKCQPITYQRGDRLFEPGDLTQGLFILESGQAALVDQKNLGERLLLERADFAGEEAAFLQPRRAYALVIKEPSQLLAISNEDVQELVTAHPEVQKNLRILAQSRKMSLRLPMPWLIKDEYIHIMTRKHPFFLLMSSLLPILAFALFFLLVLFLSKFLTPFHSILLLIGGFILSGLWLAWNINNWANDFYIITNKRMVWVERVSGLYDSRQEAPLSTLLSVGTRKTRLGSLVGYADLMVRTFVGEIRFSRIKHAAEIGKLIEAHWQNVKTSTLHDENQAMLTALKMKLAVENEDTTPLIEGEETARSPVNLIPPAREASFFEWLFADFLKVRYQVGGTIIYRKHWFILLRQTWLPLLIFLTALALLGAVVTYNLILFSRSASLVIYGFTFLASFLWLLYQYVDWRNDTFQLTLDQVIDVDRKPLGKELRRAAPLENILSIEYERRGIFALLFNFGTVYITVGATQLTFDYVYNPSEVQQDIFARIGAHLEEKRLYNLNEERERVSEWFKAYHQTTHSEPDLGDASTKPIQKTQPYENVDEKW